MQEYVRIICTHLTSDDEFMKVLGPAPEKLIETIPLAEICIHKPTMMIPCPKGFEREGKGKSVNEGQMVSVLVVTAGTAMFSALPHEAISSNEVMKFKKDPMWKEPKYGSN